MNPFEKLLEKLVRAEVRFVLVGGAAVLMQGYARNTQDLDILAEASEENARRLLNALATWGEGAARGLNTEELATPQAGALRIVEDFPLDVFTLMRARTLERDFSYIDLVADALPYELAEGLTVLVASIPRLLDLKAATGRPKDQIDIDVLTEIARGLREKMPVDLTGSELDPTTENSSDQGNWPSSQDKKQ